MTREIEVELRIAGLAVLDTANMVIHFIHADKFWLCKHRHYPLITFRAGDYLGERIPKKGSKNLLRPGIGADFLASFPLRGEVWAGGRGEIENKSNEKPARGKPRSNPNLQELDEIVTCGEIGYGELAGDYGSGMIASIHLIGGDLYADNVITSLGQQELCFKTTNTTRKLCEQIVWRKKVENDDFLVKVGKKEYPLGWNGSLQFSMTNLPQYSWLGPMGQKGIEDRRDYFRHLHLLGKLGVVNGSFCQPVLEGAIKNPRGACGELEAIRSGGSESCSPATYP